MSRLGFLRAAAVAAAAIVLGASSVPAPQAQAAPIVYSFLDGIRAELSNPGGSLPGTNDFSCEPSSDA